MTGTPGPATRCIHAGGIAGAYGSPATSVHGRTIGRLQRRFPG